MAKRGTRWHRDQSICLEELPEQPLFARTLGFRGLIEMVCLGDSPRGFKRLGMSATRGEDGTGFTATVAARQDSPRQNYGWMYRKLPKQITGVCCTWNFPQPNVDLRVYFLNIAGSSPHIPGALLL
eukprot:6475701-Amphidinium_carterae.1